MEKERCQLAISSTTSTELYPEANKSTPASVSAPVSVSRSFYDYRDKDCDKAGSCHSERFNNVEVSNCPPENSDFMVWRSEFMLFGVEGISV